MYTIQVPTKKLNSFCCHCKCASSVESEFPYFKDGWLSKLPQEKIILPSYVSRHCHSIGATIKKPAHVPCNNNDRSTYRKRTHTECYIKSNVYNRKSHQHAVLNSLVYRLLKTPLEQTEYTKEYEYILNTSVTNCFDKKLVDKKITTFRRLKHSKETTN